MSVDDPSMVYSDGSLKLDKEDARYDEYSNEGTYMYPVHSVVLNHLYVRNTKGSIGGDYDVPEVCVNHKLVVPSRCHSLA